jgi:formate/nitrite transporter
MLTPDGIVDYADHSATAKAGFSLPRFAVMAVMGGMFIALGGLLAVIVAGGSLEIGTTNPGLQKFILGAMFPMGLIAVVLTGVDLFTSNCATCTVSWYRRNISTNDVLRVWTISWLGNFVGALIVAWLFGHVTHLLAEEQPWTPYLLKMATGKLSNPFWVTFTKGILANLLVCTASWLGYSAKDTLGRMFGIWLPVMAFVTMGMEHSIANMFFIPAAMLAGLDVTWGHFITANLIPATLGNIVGGAIFIGLPYAYLFTEKREQAAADAAAAGKAQEDAAH